MPELFNEWKKAADLGIPRLVFSTDNYSVPKTISQVKRQLTTHIQYAYSTAKYHKEWSPRCVYLPGEQLMLEIMRACCFADFYEETIFFMHDQKQEEYAIQR